MKIVVDANIIFSSFLNNNSKELKILHDGKHEIYLCRYTNIELFKHKEKIMKYSKLDEEDIIDAYESIMENTYHVHEKEIPADIYKEALGLCEGIDENDTIYVAAAIFLNAQLWTGDKKLAEGLRKKGFDNIVTTEMLSIY